MNSFAIAAVKCLDHFNKIRKSCFGTVLDPSYPIHFENFKKACEEMDQDFKSCKITPKMHFLFHHIKPKIDKYGACAVLSEQTFESCHSDLYHFLEKNYHINFDDPNFSDVKNGVCAYNARRV